MCSNVSGLRQKEQSEFEDIGHLFRFLCVGRLGDGTHLVKLSYSELRDAAEKGSLTG